MPSKPLPPRSFSMTAKIPVSPSSKQAPPTLGSLLQEGLAAHRAGKFDAAEQFYGRVLRERPDHPDALTLSGALALARGRTDLAVQHTREAIKAHPGHLNAYLHLAEALEKTGRTSEAILVCRDALKQSPNFPMGQSRLAKLLADAGDNAGAIEHAQTALALSPQSIEALCALGLGLRRQNKLSAADKAYREALGLSPTDIGALAGYASFLNEVDRTQDAAHFYRLALRQLPNNAFLLGGLARVFERDDNVSAALELYDRALVSEPKSADLQYRRGCCLRHLGDFDGAAAAFRQALSVSADHAQALLALVRLKRLQDTVQVRDQLARIVAAPARAASDPIEAGFALGEILDAAGEPDAAFLRFAESNRRLEQIREANGQRFDRAATAAFVEAVDRGRAAEYVHNTVAWGNPTDLPVFVVGMPRSGTTLVEQICASHSRIVGAGELRAIQKIDKLVGALSWKRENPRAWDAGVARAQADKHAAELARIGAGALRVVDKTPLNLMNLGLIGALYPNARVIWCRRDPRDIVVSNHLMYFAWGNLYSTDQSNCAFTTRHMDRLGEIWRRELKLPILEVSYEDLVDDLDAHVRKIIDFLGVPWEPGCLEFHKTARSVTTPSSWQVRQPIYSSSVGRWRRYERHLGPMLATLAAID
jgi:tetratricopeptide (TPR) repeat protein